MVALLSQPRRPLHPPTVDMQWPRRTGRAQNGRPSPPSRGCRRHHVAAAESCVRLRYHAADAAILRPLPLPRRSRQAQTPLILSLASSLKLWKWRGPRVGLQRRQNPPYRFGGNPPTLQYTVHKIREFFLPLSGMSHTGYYSISLRSLYLQCDLSTNFSLHHILLFCLEILNFFA
jgi:hypothetical protein